MLAALYIGVGRLASFQVLVSEIPPVEGHGPAHPLGSAEEYFTSLQVAIKTARSLVAQSPACVAEPPKEPGLSLAELARREAQQQREQWKRK